MHSIHLATQPAKGGTSSQYTDYYTYKNQLFYVHIFVVIIVYTVSITTVAHLIHHLI